MYVIYNRCYILFTLFPFSSTLFDVHAARAFTLNLNCSPPSFHTYTHTHSWLERRYSKWANLWGEFHIYKFICMLNSLSIYLCVYSSIIAIFKGGFNTSLNRIYNIAPRILDILHTCSLFEFVYKYTYTYIYVFKHRMYSAADIFYNILHLCSYIICIVPMVQPYICLYNVEFNV